MNPTMIERFELCSCMSKEMMPVPPPVCHDTRFFEPMTQGDVAFG